MARSFSLRHSGKGMTPKEEVLEVYPYAEMTSSELLVRGKTFYTLWAHSEIAILTKPEECLKEEDFTQISQLLGSGYSEKEAWEHAMLDIRRTKQ